MTLDEALRGSGSLLRYEEGRGNFLSALRKVAARAREYPLKGARRIVAELLREDLETWRASIEAEVATEAQRCHACEGEGCDTCDGDGLSRLGVMMRVELDAVRALVEGLAGVSP